MLVMMTKGSAMGCNSRTYTVRGVSRLAQHRQHRPWGRSNRRRLYLRKLANAVLCTAVGICFVSSLARGQSLGAFESPPVMRASDVLPSELRAGTYHRVDETVSNDGYLNRYIIHSLFGEITVDGTDLLDHTIKEIFAIAKIEEMKRSDAFKTSFKKAITGPLRGVKSLITEPVDTVSGAVSGIGTFFGQIGHSIFGSPSEQETGTFKTILGFDAAKRQMAYKFGVDPYSYNEQLQKSLEDLTWAAFGGGFVVRVAFMAIPSPASVAVRVPALSESMNKLILQKTPAQLKSINAKKLEAMGVPLEVARTFLNAPKFSPSLTTYLVGALEVLRGVAGRELYVERAATTEYEGLAFFFERRARMHVAYNEKIAPLRRFVSVSGLPLAQAHNGQLVVLLPLDYLVWTPNTARIIEALTSQKEQLGATGIELWISGTLSPLARQNLTARGWKVVDSAYTRLQPDE